MEPRRLGDLAQAKYVVRSETVSGARATRAEDSRRNQNRDVFCEVDMKIHVTIGVVEFPGIQKSEVVLVAMFAAR